MTSIYADIFSNDERVNERYRMSINTLMRQLGEADYPLHIVNISERGFAGETVHPFSVPSIVSLALPGLGDVKARMCWTGEGRVGGEFLVPIPFDRLVAALKS